MTYSELAAELERKRKQFIARLRERIISGARAKRCFPHRYVDIDTADARCCVCGYSPFPRLDADDGRMGEKEQRWKEEQRWLDEQRGS